MPLSYGLHRDFSAGIVRDVPSHLAPDNSVYDAVDALFDQPGKIRKRGGTTNLVTGAQTATGWRIGALDTGTFDGIKALYTVIGNPNSHNIWNIDRTTGAFTALGSIGTTPIIGRPFQHYSMLVFPNYDASTPFTSLLAVGGATGAKTSGTSFTAATLTSGSDVITGITSTANAEAGMFVGVSDGVSRNYIGRVTQVISSTSIRIWPLPTFSALVNGGFNNAYAFDPISGLYPRTGGKIGLSYQNRILLFNTVTWQSSTVNEINPRRVVFSALDTEFALAGTQTLTGLPVYGDLFLADNWFEIPGSDPITAAAVAGDNVLLVFGANTSYKVIGTLLSQTTTNANLGVDVRTLSSEIGCLTQQSVQKTPRGVIFAAQDGVYATDGARITPLMSDRVANDFRDAIRSGVTIDGSAVLRGNHYYLSCSDYGRLVNLDTLAWSRVTNTRIFDGVRDPADPTKVYGLRWWNTASTPPSMTNGQTIRLDTIFQPSSTTKNDADGTAVQLQVTTRAYPDGYQKNSRRYDNPLLLKRYRHPTIEYSLAGTGTITLGAQATLDPSQGSYTSLGALPATSGVPNMTLIATPGAFRGYGIAYQFTQSGATDSFELLGLTSRYLALEFGRAA